MASDPPVVVYDACVLYPFHLRNLLIQVAVEGLVAARWTDAIHEEWIGSLVTRRGIARERLLVTRDLMKDALPKADITRYERHVQRPFTARPKRPACSCRGNRGSRVPHHHVEPAPLPGSGADQIRNCGACSKQLSERTLPRGARDNGRGGQRSTCQPASHRAFERGASSGVGSSRSEDFRINRAPISRS